MRSPSNIDEFLQEMNSIRQKKGKASHLLFNDIEQDLNEKDTFLKDQSSKIDEMIRMYSTMLAKI